MTEDRETLVAEILGSLMSEEELEALLADDESDAAESFAPSASSGDVAIGGRRGNAVEAMLEASIRYGSRILEDIARAAVSRLLAKGDIGAQQAGTLFTDEERERLAEALAAVNGTADQLARAQLRDYLRIMEERHGTLESVADSPGWLTEAADRPFEPLPPEEAVDYFKSLVPTLGTDPLFFGEAMRRQAFTLAVQTETEVLGKVQRSILDILSSGEGVRAAPKQIAKVLTDAGITETVGGVRVAGPYTSMVVRTNFMTAMTDAAEAERTDPDVIGVFPWWKYSAVGDGRSRPHHAARDGKFFDASVPFNAVRGTDIGEVANCRCQPIPLHRSEVERLKARGVTTETEW